MSASFVKEFQTGRTKMQHGLVVAAVCVLVGLATLIFAGGNGADQRWPGGLLLAIGVGLALYAWYNGRNAGTQLRIDQTGVWFREWGVTLPWGQVEDIYQTGSRMQPFVTIRVRDVEAFGTQLSQAEARKLRGNRLWKEPELRIPFNAVEATLAEMVDAIRAGMSEHE